MDILIVSALALIVGFVLDWSMAAGYYGQLARRAFGLGDDIVVRGLLHTKEVKRLLGNAFIEPDELRLVLEQARRTGFVRAESDALAVIIRYAIQKGYLKRAKNLNLTGTLTGKGRVWLKDNREARD